MLKICGTRAINQASVIIEKYVLLPLKIFTILSVSEIFAKFTVYMEKERRYKCIVKMKNDFLNEKG